MKEHDGGPRKTEDQYAYLPPSWVEYCWAAMAVNANSVMFPPAVSTCHDCRPVFLAANNCCAVTTGGASVIANNTSGPHNNATVCGCCASIASRRNLIGRSISMRSPFFHPRRIVANLPPTPDAAT